MIFNRKSLEKYVKHPAEEVSDRERRLSDAAEMLLNCAEEILKEPLPCPHGRLPNNGQDGWKHCPHCLGVNNLETQATITVEKSQIPGIKEGTTAPIPSNWEAYCKACGHYVSYKLCSCICHGPGTSGSAGNEGASI